MWQSLEGSRMTSRILVWATAMGRGRRSAFGAGEVRGYSVGHSCVCSACGHQGARSRSPAASESAAWPEVGRTRVFTVKGRGESWAERRGLELEKSGWVAEKEQAGR